jgi:hypothetical protein
MKKFQQKLKEAYNVFSLMEHSQDQKADEELKFLIKHYLLMVLSKDQFIEYNIPQIVDRIFEIVQHHISKTQNIQSNESVSGFGTPTTGDASRLNANPGIHDPTTGKPVSPEQLKAAQHILDLYAMGKMSADDAAHAIFNIETSSSENK